MPLPRGGVRIGGDVDEDEDEAAERVGRAELRVVVRGAALGKWSEWLLETDLSRPV